MKTMSTKRPVAGWRSRSGAVLALTLPMLFAACSDSTGVGSPAPMTLSFSTSSGSAQAAPAQTTGGPAGAPLIMEGSNGTLSLDEVWMIVTEVELEPVDDFCDDDDGFGDGECTDFEEGARLVQLDLDGAPVEAFDGVVPQGVYDELEFEIEDLDDDEDDPQEQAAIEELRNEILAMVPDWPRKASLYVVGTFQPVGGDPVAVRVFIEAEIEIEMDLVPSVVVDANGASTRDLVVDVRPDLWFLDSQGQVLDLREWDFDTTGRLLEFDLEIEDGFIEVEFDD